MNRKTAFKALWQSRCITGAPFTLRFLQKVLPESC